MCEITAPTTRSELARVIGVDRNTLMRWERAGEIPPPQRISRTRCEYPLADALAIQALAEAAR